ncbi:hypothetical protein CXB51_004698 [Gossypium anomalum]|uniref:Amino acid transporter transmembrane domain-containing protein n=1 Tax=Gossypium anomalum TaxID=47600 RepID=A0A8J6DE22_9ROSI|nr:hypothetical protein CXB51_004698 [Gossypium anomalum]
MAIPSHNVSECVDDDVVSNEPYTTTTSLRTICTASAHIITAVIGSGVLSLAWAIAQLGWIAGPAVMLLFSFVTYYTSSLLTDCYRTGDPVSGKRNYTYTDAVRSILGGYKVKACGLIQYLNLFGISIGYTIAASISMIFRSDMVALDRRCGHVIYLFGHRSWSWNRQVAATGTFKGSLTGISIGTVTQAQKIWRSLQAIGDIAFAYSFSVILIEIQDTVIKSPPEEAKTMKKATKLSVAVTTAFYMLCGCMGYASFGDFAPGNLLTGFGFFNPFWLLDIANAAIIIHLVGAYQVFCQPIFAFIEKWATQRWPESYFITKEFKIPVPGYRHPYKFNMFRLVWRTGFVMLTTVISMLLPFFNDVVGILGALGFWPLTVYFPVEMYIQQKKISKWSSRWICLKMLSMACLMISIVAGAGSIVGVVLDLKVYKPFKTTY